MLIGKFRGLNAYLVKKGNTFLVCIKREKDENKYILFNRNTDILDYTDIFSFGEINGCQAWIGIRENEIKEAMKAYREGQKTFKLIPYILPD